MKTKIPGLLGAALLAGPITAYSIPLTYDFSVDGGSSGPLAGVTSSGYFSFDSSIIPNGGGLLGRTGLLTDLAFTWNGISYDETTANTGSLIFDASGALTGATFGTTCQAFGCQVSSRSIGWDISWNPSLYAHYFTYSFGNGRIGSGTPTITEALPAPVPEPSSMGLLGLGLGGLWLAGRRRRAGQASARARDGAARSIAMSSSASGACACTIDRK
ncbi:MAG TPA: PEP-CTERM sorting domain-containing protein [Gammaproteobacteria bacterium]|nr:PEP-CTERM sorting domain-containing protein [Gammaproteobacteria bacterium]